MVMAHSAVKTFRLWITQPLVVCVVSKLQCVPLGTLKAVLWSNTARQWQHVAAACAGD